MAAIFPRPDKSNPLTEPDGRSALQAWYDFWGYLETQVKSIASLLTSVDTLNKTVGYGYFHVNRNGTNQTGATAGVFNKIQFTNEVVDSQGFWDNATNYRFQPTQAGWYFFHVATRADNSATETPQSALYKNGSVALTGTYQVLSAGTGRTYGGVSGLIQLNGSTDYVEAFLYLPTGITTINGPATDTYMFGYRAA